MQQYFINQALTLNQPFSLSNEQKHHILTVMRYGVGKHVRVIDVDAKTFICEIVSTNPFQLMPFEQRVELTEPSVDITLIVGWIKKERFEWMLQKVSEAGATRVIPLISAYTVVKEKEDTLDKKLIRYNKITEEAAEQSRRTRSTEVLAPISLAAVGDYLSDVNVVAYERPSSKHLKHMCLPGKSMTVIIGPEGGFNEKEIELLESYGVDAVTLGPRILRTETAALAACVVIDTMLG